MLKSYRAFMNGKYYYAVITPREQADGVELTVYSKDWKGNRIPAFSMAYKNEYAAERGLKAHFPNADWQEE